MPRDRQIPDCPAFRRAWAEVGSHPEIAALFGVSRGAVGHARQRYGYPRRQDVQEIWGGRRVAAWVAAAPDPDPRPPAPVAVVTPLPAPSVAHPRWSAAEDAEVIRTQGRYAELSAAADRLGRSLREVQCRWHQLRAAA